MDLTLRPPMSTGSFTTRKNISYSHFSTSILYFLILLFCSVEFTSAGWAPRKFIHSREEIKLTGHVTIAQTRCAKNETPIFVHTAAHTSGKYFDRRMAIRKTWAREAKEANLKVIFVIGIPANASTQLAIKREAATYGDLLQFAFTEAYFNITLKAIAELHWSARHCNGSSYILRVDDDVLVNVPRLAAGIAEGKFRPGLTGQVEVTEAHREPDNKWYMPPQYYPADSYPFLKGFGYLLSTDRLPKLLTSMDRYRGFVLDIDDIYVTGILADYAQIERNHDVGFRHYCGPDVCVLENSLVIYGCAFSSEAEAMYEEWKKMDSSSKELCLTNEVLEVVDLETIGSNSTELANEV